MLDKLFSLIKGFSVVWVCVWRGGVCCSWEAWCVCGSWEAWVLFLGGGVCVCVVTGVVVCVFFSWEAWCVCVDIWERGWCVVNVGCVLFLGSVVCVPFLGGVLCVSFLGRRGGVCVVLGRRGVCVVLGRRGVCVVLGRRNVCVCCSWVGGEVCVSVLGGRGVCVVLGERGVCCSWETRCVLTFGAWWWCVCRSWVAWCVCRSWGAWCVCCSWGSVVYVLFLGDVVCVLFLGGVGVVLGRRGCCYQAWCVCFSWGAWCVLILGGVVCLCCPWRGVVCVFSLRGRWWCVCFSWGVVCVLFLGQGFPESVSACCMQKRPQLDRESGSLQGSSRTPQCDGKWAVVAVSRPLLYAARTAEFSIFRTFSYVSCICVTWWIATTKQPTRVWNCVLLVQQPTGQLHDNVHRILKHEPCFVPHVSRDDRDGEMMVPIA